ncbi:hypothetical protein V6N11_060684 [Hibiscus sabdariffa]|uniref:WRKY domain-containing protein n=1 Tax=Hibiscus sabdariffa TaxID=183260 RepID=A0ABR2QR29_9ROSI
METNSGHEEQTNASNSQHPFLSMLPRENEMVRSCCSTSVNGCCRPVDVEVARTDSCVCYNMRPNYYRCAAEACKVKKRVERESQDPRFVITTYQGKHNHSDRQRS